MDPRVFHVGLTVSNVERSLAFYRDIVGMAVVYEGELCEDSFDRLTHNLGSHLRVAHLQMGDVLLQLVEYLAGGDPDHLALAHHRVGNPHLCIQVDDADAKYDELRARGDVPITSDVIEGKLGYRSFYATDPDGVMAEFLTFG